MLMSMDVDEVQSHGLRRSSGQYEDLPSTTTFDALQLKDFLEVDPRPSFTLDLHPPTSARPRIVYANRPMIGHPWFGTLYNNARDMNQPSVAGSAEFWSWIKSTGQGDCQDESDVYTFRDMRWTRLTIKSRWRIIHGCNACRIPTDGSIYASRSDTGVASRTHETVSPPIAQRSRRPPSPTAKRSAAASSTTTNISDWTSLHPPDVITPHVQLARNFDWSNTSLGPMNTWSTEFRTACNLLMADARPAALLWGPDYNMLWNEAYYQIIGDRHPAKFGLPFRDVFPELPDFVTLLDSIKASRESIMQEDSPFFLVRNGLMEETFFTFTLIPIFEGNQVVGIYNPAFDTTRRIVAERGMTTLIRVGDTLAASRDMKQFWTRLVQGLEQNQHDFPLAAVYSVGVFEDVSDAGSHSSEMSDDLQLGFKKLTLQGVVGFPVGHPAAVAKLDLAATKYGFEPYLTQAAVSGDVIPLHKRDGTLSESLLQDVRCGILQDLCQSIVIVPIKYTTGVKNIGGFVILGLNPRRPFNQDYHIFINLLSQSFGTNMAATVLIEEELRRSARIAKQAALDKARLEEDLARSTFEAKRLEMQFTHFADKAPIGISVFKPDGKVVHANKIWYDLTAYDRTDEDPMGWMNRSLFVGSEDAQDVWHALLAEKTSVIFECRMKKPWKPPGATSDSEMQDFSWVLVSAFPELDPTSGAVQSIVACFSDITNHKWAETIQTRRMNEAIEARKMQENFVDMTSHEMRNPLSAIVHCCDGIIDTLNSATPASSRIIQISHDAVNECLEAARTILHCAIHQKRMVDDILVLSKLDADLLYVAPVNVQLQTTVEATISMFQAEAKSADIELSYVIDRSISALDVDLVYLDPSRLAQVIINLLTNAIKFTRSEARRSIEVLLAASIDRPDSSVSVVKYVPPKDANFEIPMSDEEWGTGRDIYISVAISDTGKGLTPSEADLLFRRFSQASPRTHVRYGGSGLGLYIARQLVEKLGGRIGVTSRADEGSTFAFFVRARQAMPSPEIGPTNGTRRSSSQQSSTNLTRVFSNSQSISDRISNTRDVPRQPVQKISAPGKQRFPILIVEDNVVNRMVLKKQLERLNFVIYEANHGQEALDFLEKTRFWTGHAHSGIDLTLVLLDQEMPVMNGLTCVRRIRELEHEGTLTAHIPVIAVTANARKEQIDTALEAGMDSVVCKPFRIPDLVKQMEELLSGLEIPS